MAGALELPTDIVIPAAIVLDPADARAMAAAPELPTDFVILAVIVPALADAPVIVGAQAANPVDIAIQAATALDQVDAPAEDAAVVSLSLSETVSIAK